jgi:chemotaxis protein MotA
MADSAQAELRPQGRRPAPAVAALPTRRARSVDGASLAGLVAAFVLVAAAAASGGTIGSFFDLPSMAIVVGGTFAVTTISFSLSEVMRAQPAMLQAVFGSAPDPQSAARLVLRLADAARRRGLLALQTLPAGIDPFLARAVALVVDGTKPEEAERIIGYDRAAAAARQSKSVAVLRRAAEVAPAMGLIGTLVGLVQMLGTLNDPGNIGPSMALALVTTLYGALLANMIFAPIATKLERNAAVEDMTRNIYALGVLSIARQENPRRLELLLNTVLPPESRLRFFD